jgi:hypothetical protein
MICYAVACGHLSNYFFCHTILVFYFLSRKSFINFQDIPLYDVVRDLKQQIAQLPKFSVLRLHLLTWGHVFGAMVLNLLGFCAGIQSLKLVVPRNEVILHLNWLRFQEICTNCISAFDVGMVVVLNVRIFGYCGVFTSVSA